MSIVNLLTISDKIGSHFRAHEHGYRKSVASTPYVLCRPAEKQRGKRKEGGEEGVSVTACDSVER